MAMVKASTRRKYLDGYQPFWNGMFLGFCLLVAPSFLSKRKDGEKRVLGYGLVPCIQVGTNVWHVVPLDTTHGRLGTRRLIRW